MKENLVYITSNKGKFYSVNEKAKIMGVNLNFENLDIEELEINDLSKIAKDKTIKAFKKVGKPCFTIDCGFYIEDYPNNPGYPGAFVKRSGIANNIEKLLDDMKNVKNRKAYFKDCLVFYDGNKFYEFSAISKGIISSKVNGADQIFSKSRLWQVFIPDGYNKTLAQFTEEELKKRSLEIDSATTKFFNWYLKNYKR